MASIYITEFSGLKPGGGLSQQPQVAGAPIAAQAVAIGGSSTQSTALNAATTLIRVFAGAMCTISIGTNPTATATDHIQLGEEQFDYFWVSPGDKVAVITRA